MVHPVLLFKKIGLLLSSLISLLPFKKTLFEVRSNVSRTNCEYAKVYKKFNVIKINCYTLCCVEITFNFLIRAIYSLSMGKKFCKKKFY